MQAAQLQQQEYSSLVPPPGQHEHQLGAGAMCDRCLQPIDAAMFQANLARLQEQVDSTKLNQAAAAGRAAGTQAR